jgi:hypothetical protein
LRTEIDLLEQSRRETARTGEPGDPVAFDRFVRRLRSSMTDEELVTKREQIESLAARVAELQREFPDLAEEEAKEPFDRRKVLVPLAGAVGVLVGGSVIFGVVALLMNTIFAPPSREVIRELAPLINRAVTESGETIFANEFEFPYRGGTVMLSGDPPQDTEFGVDDRLIMTVTRPDGTTQIWDRTFNQDCMQNGYLPAQDVTSLFQEGVNTVSVSITDVCGSTVGTLGRVMLSAR